MFDGEKLNTSRKKDIQEAKQNNLDSPNEMMGVRNLTNHAMVHISTDLKEVGAVPILDFQSANKKMLKSISLEAFKTLLIQKKEEGTDNPNLIKFQERTLFVSMVYSLLASIKDLPANEEDSIIQLHQKIDKWIDRIKKEGYDTELILNKSHLSGLYEEYMNPNNYGADEKKRPDFEVHNYLAEINKSGESFTYDEFLEFILELSKLTKQEK